MVAVIRKWLRTKETFPLTKTYFSYFKENYRETLLMSWIYGVIGVVLLVDLSFIHNWYLRIALYIAAFLYLLSALYIFPIMAHYDWKGYFFKMKMAFLFGFSHLHYSLVLILSLVGIYLMIIQTMPGVFNLYRWQSLLFRSHVDSKFYILPFGMEELIYRKNRRKQKYH